MAGPAPATRPILASLAGYRPAWLKGDIAAGLAIAAVGLPTAIAYPAIAGLPPETGLYASIAPLVAYAVFGPSRFPQLGPPGFWKTLPQQGWLNGVPSLRHLKRWSISFLRTPGSSSQRSTVTSTTTTWPSPLRR